MTRPPPPPFDEGAARAKVLEFAPDGLMRRREAGINDVPVTADDRRIFCPR